MTTAEVLDVDGTQLVKLPAEFRVGTPSVSIRKAGNAIILEPISPTTWPPNFFAQIKIDDPAFSRPAQGAMPPAPSFD